MGARLNARLETLDIDDVFFETKTLETLMLAKPHEIIKDLS